MSVVLSYHKAQEHGFVDSCSALNEGLASLTVQPFCGAVPPPRASRFDKFRYKFCSPCECCTHVCNFPAKSLMSFRSWRENTAISRFLHKSLSTTRLPKAEHQQGSPSPQTKRHRLFQTGRLRQGFGETSERHKGDEMS